MRLIWLQQVVHALVVDLLHKHAVPLSQCFTRAVYAVQCRKVRMQIQRHRSCPVALMRSAQLSKQAYENHHQLCKEGLPVIRPARPDDVT